MVNYSNFYSNVCLFLNTLNRGVLTKTPRVSVKSSKIGLDLCKTLRNLGLIESFACVQRHNRVRHSHYARWTGDHEPHTTAEYQGYPGMYLFITLNYNMHKPLFQPANATHVRAPLHYFDPVLTCVKLLSKPTRQTVIPFSEIARQRDQHSSGIFLMSTPKGVITDIEAELYRTGGVLLAHLQTPLSYVAQIRGGLRAKYLQEMEQKNSQQRIAVRDWSLRDYLANTVTGRLVEPVSGASFDDLLRQAQYSSHAPHQHGNGTGYYLSSYLRDTHIDDDDDDTEATEEEGQSELATTTGLNSSGHDVLAVPSEDGHIGEHQLAQAWNAGSGSSGDKTADEVELLMLEYERLRLELELELGMGDLRDREFLEAVGQKMTELKHEMLVWKLHLKDPNRFKQAQQKGRRGQRDNRGFQPNRLLNRPRRPSE